jgi:predicted dehydrogenase
LRVAQELLPNAEVRVLTRQTFKNDSDNKEIQFSDLQQAINFLPQLTIVCNAATNHIEIAQIFAELNSHLLIEKPISHSEAGVVSLIETCKARSLQLLVGYNLRFLDSLQQFKREIDNGRAGTVLTFRSEVGHYLPNWRPDQNYQQTVSARRELGGGVLSELSHELDYLLWIFGEVLSVESSLFKVSNLDINVEDLASLTLEIKSHLNPKPIVGHLTLDFIRHDPTRCCTVIGTEGTVKWDGIAGTVKFWKIESQEWIDVPCKNMDIEETYYLEWKSLLAKIDANITSSYSAEQALRVVQLIDAAREASALRSTQSM